jgi:hypothetical protein
MIYKHQASGFTIGAVIASALGAGCAANSPAGDDPATAATTSSLSGTSLVSMIAVNLNTGNDDKRGDSHVWIQIDLLDQNGHPNSTVQEVGAGAPWPNWSWSGWHYIALPSSTRNQDITDVKISWQQGGGGWNGDNWNLQSFQVYALDGTNGQWSFQGAPGGNPLLRFTGSVNEYVWGWSQ